MAKHDTTMPQFYTLSTPKCTGAGFTKWTSSRVLGQWQKVIGRRQSIGTYEGGRKGRAVKQSWGVLALIVGLWSMLPFAASAPSGQEVRFYPDPDNGVLWVVGVLPEKLHGDIEIIYNGQP